MLTYAPFEAPDFEAPDEPGDQQGEILVLPLQFVVAPDHGRFHPTTPTHPGSTRLDVGALVGEVRNHTTTLKVHSPFRGSVDLWLVTDGQIVTPGQPLCSLHPTTPTPAPRTQGG